MDVPVQCKADKYTGMTLDCERIDIWPLLPHVKVHNGVCLIKALTHVCLLAGKLDLINERCCRAGVRLESTIATRENQTNVHIFHENPWDSECSESHVNSNGNSALESQLRPTSGLIGCGTTLERCTLGQP